MTPTSLARSLFVDGAADPAARERGLMDRTALHGVEGMLFLFDAPTAGAFWNQRTFLPLDLLFADAHGRIVDRIAMQTIEETRGHVVPYTPRAPYVAALEVLRGRAPAGVTQMALSPHALPDRRRVVFLYETIAR